MVSFSCDYLEGAHPRVLELLQSTNYEQTPGYGEDAYCRQAAALIRNLCEADDAAVHFLVGGTQTNAAVISAALKPYQGVLSAESGHINVHETGAVEAYGHKVLALPAKDGKISGDQVRHYCKDHWQDGAHEHMVQPGLVYISHPTELGTLYSKAELEDLFQACHEYGIRLFLDGARLAYALAAEGSDVTLPDLARLTDVFYIGGTKCGALFGEAVVISNPELQRDFRYIIKQHGGMLAKGRLLGLQFLALLEDGLYLKLGAHGNVLAKMITDACTDAGIELLAPAESNQLFLILSSQENAKLEESFEPGDIMNLDDGRLCQRFVTSWATREEDAAALAETIRGLRK